MSAIRGVQEVDDLVPVKVVLASVFNKTGLDELASGIIEQCPGVVFVSTGGTYDALKKGLDKKADSYLIHIERFTGARETEGGLVKTLSREVALGLLTETYSAAHQADLEREKVMPIDLVLCNLYPFFQVVAKPDTTHETARGNIDIGGPTMIRAAAKNFLRCAAVVDPEDYNLLVNELKRNNGQTSFHFRQGCMKKAFAHTAEYDRRIAEYFATVTPEEAIRCYATVHNQTS